MNNFCTSCGAPLGEGAKFCIRCGAAAPALPDEDRAAPEVATTDSSALAAKSSARVKAKAKKEAKTYTEKFFTNPAPALSAAGELALPLELIPFSTVTKDGGLFSVLRSGLSSFKGSYKRALSDKKRLNVVIMLTAIWLLVNVLAALGIFPLPVRLLSWLTAARGSFVGGTIGKGLVAALFAQVVADKSTLMALKSGLGQLGGVVKGGQGKFVPLSLGAGAALIACNVMVSTTVQNLMVCIAGFALSAKALTQNGFLRRFITGLLPKAKDASVTSVMGGWTIGFALFAMVSALPGGQNGYLLGILLLISGSILAVTKRNKKEVSAE